MRVLVNEQVDREKWNRFVYENPRGNIFQTYEMYEVYGGTKGTTPLLLAVEEDGKILAGLLSVIFSNKNPIINLFSSRAIIQGGPLYSDKKALSQLMKAYEERVHRKVIFSQVRNIFDTNEIKGLLQKFGYEYEPHLDYLIDLKISEELLWQKISKSKRKAIKLGKVKVDVTESLDGVYSLLKETYKSVKVPLIDYSHFIAAKRILGDKLKIYVAKLPNNKTVGCRMVLCYKGMVYDWYAGAKTELTELFINDCLVWDILKDNLGAYEVFDFGGAGHPDKPYGVREFKRRFGGEMVNFGRFNKVYRPLTMKVSRRAYSLFQKFR